MTHLETFKNLHQQDSTLVLGNVWNTQSSLLFQQAGYKAIGTSSAAIAQTLGYDDGEQMPFRELVHIVKNIQSKIKIPLTVDIEGGFSREASTIAANIAELHALGVVGINIEDSVSHPEKTILHPEKFSNVLQEVAELLLKNNVDIFINVRTDAYILGLENPFEETLKRINHYKKCGIDGIFVPCVVQEKEIGAIVKATSLPINVMCMPNLPTFKTLESLGVKRISMGPFLYNKMHTNLEKGINTIAKNQSFNSLFA